ncbi:MAG: hypothetical protein ACOYL3_23860 [Desulfuromonadaceae bacterium]
MLKTGVAIAVSASAAWELLTDTTRWPQWGPSVSGVDSAEQYIGPGSSGRVQAIIGVWRQEGLGAFWKRSCTVHEQHRRKH